MPIWNEKLQKWGYHYYEEVFDFTWLGIRRDMPIDKPFAYHKPSDTGLNKINELRLAFSEVKAIIEANCPESRQRSVALTELETSAMWAIKAVVFNDPKSEVSS